MSDNTNAAVLFFSGIALMPLGCQMDGASGDELPVSQIEQRIFGDETTRDDNAGFNTFYDDIVVKVFHASSSCSGTLITPRLVLTAAHCFKTPGPRTVYVGPRAGSWRSVVMASSAPQTLQAPTDDDSNGDLALLTLDKPIMELADSRRPLVWNNWSEDGWFGDAAAAFGIAGWSTRAGPWECPSGDPGPTDAEHIGWRQHAEPVDQLSFGKLPGDDAITWFTTNSNKPTRGDSGGPLYRVSSSGRREVIGVLSRGVCNWNLSEYIRSSLYTNVTNGRTASWIEDQAKDDRTPMWLAKHGVSTLTHWRGEVDYTGACIADRDSDCDHWYDVHDDCPFDYNPEQEEDPNGRGYACKTRGILDKFDPADPRPAHKSIDLGSCTSDQPECPVGICYFTEIDGQFWARPTEAPVRIDDPSYRGSYARIAIVNGRYKLELEIKPDEVSGEFYAPPRVKAECLPLRDIKSIGAPDQCQVAHKGIQGGPPLSGQVALHIGIDSFNVLSGLAGNVGFPGSETAAGRTSLVAVNNASGAPVLRQRRDQSSLGRAPLLRGFGAEAMSVSCPGWISGFRPAPDGTATWTVAAFAVPTTVTLVPGEQAATAACFIEGVGGPWGGWSQASSSPVAKIHVDPGSGDILATVTPSGIAGSLQSVEARIACIDLSP